MKTTELRMSSVGFKLFQKYVSQLQSVNNVRSVDIMNNYRIDVGKLSELNDSLRRLSMTLEYVLANEVSEVELNPDSSPS